MHYIQMTARVPFSRASLRVSDAKDWPDSKSLPLDNTSRYCFRLE